jgi:aminoglycoside/choline kinase family phosphotransferase
MITYIMDHLISAGIERLIVNTHHCADAYHRVFPDQQWQGIPILFRYEPVLLDTAGGLKNIEDLLEQDNAVLVYNGDILSDIPLKPILDAYRKRKKEVTLALRSNGFPLNVNINDRGDVCDLRNVLGNAGIRSCLFTGIYIVQKSFLRRLTAGRIESVVPVFINMIREAPGKIAGVIIDEGSWHDIGSVEEYQKLQGAFLHSDPLKMQGGKSLIIPGAHEHDVSNIHHEMSDFVKKSLAAEISGSVRMTPLAGGGSNRSFHRILAGDGYSAIFMKYDITSEENTRYAVVAEFLGKIGVPVPRIIAHDPLQGFVVMEDLGDTDLWSFRKQPWEVRRDYYRKTLDAVYKLHAFPLETFSFEGLSPLEAFGPRLYRWEQDYFLDHFVAGVCNIEISPFEKRALEDELRALSDHLETTKPCLVHRDFQSQNIMIKNGNPFLIDFQGMRSGSFFYDLGSLLYDPYVSLSDDERLELRDYYFFLLHQGIQNLDKRNHGNAKQETPCKTETADYSFFHRMFFEASAQRIMQALGAYGFLGLKSNKPDFLLHIPMGISNLLDITYRLRDMPVLHNLAETCKEVLQQKGFNH